MKLLISMLYCIVIGAANTAAVAQQQTPTSKHLMREDSAAVNALVMYPDTIRLHIFEACEYPAAIVSIASLQKNTSDEFVNLISSYSKNEQEDFWNLTRYPSLISSLAQGGKKSEDQINAILVDYPADIHETALKYGTEYYDQIQEMDEIQSQSDAQFEQIIADYPTETQEALRDIIQFPEIISLLNDHLSLTVRVGDHFRRNPQGVIHRADSLNLAETRQKAEDAEAWKQTIEQNPDEANDLQNAAKDYATENGYTQEEVNTSPNPDDVSNYTCNPYSYWFGYPTWYPYSYWYPYPYWFDCGFYHDRSGRIVIIGSPSHYFTNWYFYYPEHWHHYPNLCNAYINHYYGPRRSTGANSLIVHNWVRNNRNYLPNDFITNHSKRNEVIRQVGQLNMDAQKQKGGKPVSPAVRDEYFQKNKSKYPSLNAGQRTRMQRGNQQPNIPDVIQQPVKQPPVRIPTPVQQPVRNPRQPSAPPTGRIPNPVQQPVTNPRLPSAPPAGRIPTPVQQPVTNPRPPSAPRGYNFNNINKAQEYHRNVWDQTQPTVKPQPQQAPRTQTQPTVRPQPQQAPRTQAQQPVKQEPTNRPSPGKRK
ncbi:MAG: hypothetical protein WBW16_07380 [Bacteroidota bacterium]